MIGVGRHAYAPVNSIASHLRLFESLYLGIRSRRHSIRGCYFLETPLNLAAWIC